MSRAANTWTCAKCGTVAFTDQNFCRVCGTPRGPKRPAPITAQVPVITRDTRPPEPGKRFPRVALVLIAVLFVVVGGLAALIFNDLRGDEPANPDETPTATTTATTVAPSTTLQPATTAAVTTLPTTTVPPSTVAATAAPTTVPTVSSTPVAPPATG